MVSTNNSSDIKNQGVQYFNGTGTFSGIDGSTANFVLTSNGTGVAPSFQAPTTGTFQVNTQVFTSSGTYTPTSGMVYCIVELVGGGAGGAGNGAATSVQIAVSGGGGGGSYSRKTIDAATVGASQSITIGAGGAGGTTGSPFKGGDGGTTSFGSIFNATGGIGPLGSVGGAAIYLVNLPGIGDNTSTGGDFSSAGGPGSPGMGIVTTPNGQFAVGGNGGNSIFGGGALLVLGGQSDGRNAIGYGGGGSGSICIGNSGSVGGDGFQGIAIVTEFII